MHLKLLILSWMILISSCAVGSESKDPDGSENGTQGEEENNNNGGEEEEENNPAECSIEDYVAGRCNGAGGDDDDDDDDPPITDTFCPSTLKNALGYTFVAQANERISIKGKGAIQDPTKTSQGLRIEGQVEATGVMIPVMNGSDPTSYLFGTPTGAPCPDTDAECTWIFDAYFSKHNVVAGTKVVIKLYKDASSDSSGGTAVSCGTVTMVQ